MEKDKFETTSSEDLVQDIKMIYTMSSQITAVTAPNLEDWMNFLSEYLSPVENYVTASMIQSKIDVMSAENNFATIFPANSRCVATVMPCDYSGEKYQIADVLAGNHLVLLVFPSNITDQNHPQYFQKLLADFQPQEIRQECSFDIGKYVVSPVDDSSESVHEKARILALYAQALSSLARRLSIKAEKSS